MTGRTHDLAAFTLLNAAFILLPAPKMSIATLGVAIGANMIGGLLPDIDNQSADIWDKIRWGNILSRLIKPFVGKHRMLSHSLIGLVIISFLVKLFLSFISPILLVDMDVVWWAFVIGYMSHLISDTLTTQGVPWLLPIPIYFGIPPFKFLRIKTGGLLEKILVFPGLLLINGYLVYTHYSQYVGFIKSYLQ